MFDERTEILEQLLAGEDATAEFKEVRLGEHGVISPNTEDFAGECVAFANAEGGAIFIGVDDEGVVRGVPVDRLGDIEQWVVNVATNNCDPPLRPLIRKEALPKPDGTDGRALVVELRRGIYVHRTSGGRYYVRVGSSKRDLDPQALARLFQERGRAFVYDEQPVAEAPRGDLDQGSLNDFFGVRPAIPWRDLLINTRVLVFSDSVDRPTIAGLLLFAREPQQHLRSAYIEATVYRRRDLSSDDLIHAEQIGGRVDQQIDGATAFVERFMLKPARKPAGREDFPQYEIGAIHEAIVNAVAHRDYSLAGANEGRGINPGDTRQGAPLLGPLSPALNEGRGINPGDTRHPSRRTPRRRCALNKGRGINPGDTRAGFPVGAVSQARSTKAGASTPATRAPTTARHQDCMTLNEGRGINPGDTWIIPRCQSQRFDAQRRPGHQPRRHPGPPVQADYRPPRSTKAGASTPATRGIFTA